MKIGCRLIEEFAKKNRAKSIASRTDPIELAMSRNGSSMSKTPRNWSGERDPMVVDDARDIAIKGDVEAMAV